MRRWGRQRSLRWWRLPQERALMCELTWSSPVEFDLSDTFVGLGIGARRSRPSCPQSHIRALCDGRHKCESPELRDRMLERLVPRENKRPTTDRDLPARAAEPAPAIG